MPQNACHYHTGTKATHVLERGHRGEPVPLCQACVDELAQIGIKEDVDNLIRKV